MYHIQQKVQPDIGRVNYCRSRTTGNQYGRRRKQRTPLWNEDAPLGFSDSAAAADGWLRLRQHSVVVPHVPSTVSVNEWWLSNDSLSCDLPHCSVSSWHILLTQHKLFDNCLTFIIINVRIATSTRPSRINLVEQTVHRNLSVMSFSHSNVD